MGRKRATSAGGKQQPLNTMEDEFEVPEAVQLAADKYSKSLKSKNKSAATFTASKEDLIQTMVDEQVTRVRISTESGDKYVICETDHKLRYEAIKEGGDEE